MPYPAPYSRAGSPGEPSPSGLTRGEVLRSLLWIVAVTSAVTNLVLSFGDTDVWVHLLCGTVTMICGGILVARRLKARR